MKLISWNVNWIRANLKKWFLDYLKSENPDIIWLQEIRAEEEQVKNELEEIKTLGYEIYWNNAEKKWYSWTAIFTKIKPIKVFYWIWEKDLESKLSESCQVFLFDEDGWEKNNREWRVIIAEYDKFYFVTVYTPNAQRELTRLEYRQKWDNCFLEYMKKLEQDKPIIFCWDLNVAHTEIDLANPKSNKNNAGFTMEERNWFTNFINNWFVDTFRYLNPELTWAYSWWSNFWNARSKNVGWRIDYFVISDLLKKDLKNAFIRPEIHGSDHCPVWIEIF